MGNVEEAVARVMRVYDEETATSRTNAAEALEITEGILDELDGRAAGLRSDVGAGRGR